ncbi:MAG: hypothetical protein KIT22_20235, partial [Verrucomicrobiae bacterium]|nr:hypothetical protein [Verrucomicrobiae bacterium]
SRAIALKITCNGHLKNISFSFRIFTTDNGGYFPFQISTNGIATTNQPPANKLAGGTREYASDPASVWRHFAVLSNELSVPVILYCPADRERSAATDWAQFTNNRFLSYTLGLTTSWEDPQGILSSDRNLLLDGMPLTNAMVTLRSNSNLALDRRIHVDPRTRAESGNLLLGDGSVHQISSAFLREITRGAIMAGRPQQLVIP